MEIDWATGILFEIIASHVDLAMTVVVDKDGKHVVFNGSLLIQTRDKQLGTRVLSRGRQTNDSCSGKAFQILLCYDILKQIVSHATIAQFAVLHQTDIILRIIADHRAFAIIELSWLLRQLHVGFRVVRSELVVVLHAPVAVFRLNPDPTATSIEDHLEHLLVAADVDNCIQLDVIEIIEILFDVVVVLIVVLSPVMMILIEPKFH